MKALICQSCGFPFSKKSSGTRRDHSLSTDYCIDCFKNGEFTDHHLTLHDMERRLLEMARMHNELSLEEANEIIRILPDLKRWRMTNILWPPGSVASISWQRIWEVVFSRFTSDKRAPAPTEPSSNLFSKKICFINPLSRVTTLRNQLWIGRFPFSFYSWFILIRQNFILPFFNQRIVHPASIYLFISDV